MTAARIEVRLRPRGHADELLGISDGVLLVEGIEESELIARLGSDV